MSLVSFMSESMSAEQSSLMFNPLSNIVRSIIADANGAMLDPSDMTTMFQDAAGTTPVTAVEQPVGKIIDKSCNGNHATQSVTASRPTLSARKNLLLATETLATQSVASIAASYVLSFYGAGSVTLSGTSTQVLTGTGVNNRASVAFTPTAGTLTLTVSGSVTKAQLELGTSAGPYQRVNTAMDYDTDPRYFPKYLRFDGVDDYLNLPYMGLYANGSASVVAVINGHQYGKTFNGRILCESLVSSNAPTYAPLIQLYSYNTTNAYITNNAATVFVNTGLLLAQNIVSAISMIDSGASIKSYQNSSQKAASAYTRSGTVTLDSTTIGKRRNNGSTEIWQGDLYGLIITKSALSDAQRIQCERYLGHRSGVQL